MKLRDYYRSLSSENRVHFWTIATSCIVAVITFWMGLSIQYIVYNQNLDNSKKLAHYQIVERMHPLYISQFDSCQNIMPLLQKSINEKEPVKAISNVIVNNVDEFIRCAKISAKIMGENKYYFDGEEYKKINLNNSYILLGSKIIELSRSNINSKKQLQDSITKYIESYEFISQCDYNSNIENIAKLAAQLINTELGKTLEFMVCNKMIVPYLIANLELMNHELVGETTNRETLFLQCFIFLFASIIIGFILFCMLVRLTFNKSNIMSKRSTNEIEKLANMVKSQKIEISRLESCLFSKDQNIDKLKETLNKKTYISQEMD